MVQPRDMADAGPALEQELIAYCREHLSHLKCPRSVDFEAELPPRHRQAVQAAVEGPVLGGARVEDSLNGCRGGTSAEYRKKRAAVYLAAGVPR